MERVNVKNFFCNDDIIICPKCNLDLSSEAKDPWIAHENFNDDNGFVSCTGEEYVICPKCGHEVTLRTWEEF